MIQQEVIKTQTGRRGTFIKYFTNYSGQTSADGTTSYLITDLRNSPIKIVESNLDTQVYRNLDNNFISLSGMNIYSGTTILQQSEFLNQSQKNTISSGYINLIQSQFLASSFLMGTTPISYVQFEDIELDDMYVNITIHREIDSLDTLNIYNVPINSTTTKDSDTGVLFGRLEAIQSIQTEDGKKIRIPLKNTPVAIFNSTEEFPSIGVTNEDDNRITLNIRENTNVGDYFNAESERTDLKFLTNTSQFKSIPDKYKYTAFTNENGEFIIYNVPVGEQTLMYEVNLLKQGLTADEVALNFFQYPTEDNPKVDKVPHYFFRQQQVNIVPSWGTFQTGYTEINITVSLDLRKWCTYYISPIAYKEKTLEQNLATGVNTRITCGIRDMTKSLDENRPAVEVVEIADIYNRNFEQVTEWSGEFKQKKNKVEFFTSQFNAFKLPANLYDPNGIGTNGKKGVWLAAYQLKMYYSNEKTIYRATGYEREWIVDFGAIGRNHFNLNKNADYGIIPATEGNVPIGKLGKFPYEKSWTINYPEPYKIPKQPNQKNPNKLYDSNGRSISQTEPLYLDGDLIGYAPWDNNFVGYASQLIAGEINVTEFSREVTKNAIFKYESLDQWDEQYSNGYQPAFPQSSSSFGTVSNVLNGEKWQRLEAGYAYWLRPEGWPRIENYAWGSAILDSDRVPTTQYGPFIPAGLNSPDSHVSEIFLLRENILLRMEQTIPYKTGGLDIYRVKFPNDLVKPLPPPQDSFATLNFGYLIGDGTVPAGDADQYETDFPAFFLFDGSKYPDLAKHAFFPMTNLNIRIYNRGTNQVVIEGTTLEPGEYKDIADYLNCLGFGNNKITLPGNYGYNALNNTYTKARYEILFDAESNYTTGSDGTLRQSLAPHGQSAGMEINLWANTMYINVTAGLETTIPDYYLNTSTVFPCRAPWFDSDVRLHVESGTYIAAAQTNWIFDLLTVITGIPGLADALTNLTIDQLTHLFGNIPRDIPFYARFYGMAWFANHDGYGAHTGIHFSNMLKEWRITPFEGTIGVYPKFEFDYFRT